MDRFASNVALADRHLARFREQALPHFVAGKAWPGEAERTFEVVDPATGHSIGRAASAGSEEVDVAVQAAKAAFPAWARVGGQARRDLLHRIADAITAHAEEIALVESSDTGQPIRFMTKAAERGAENFRFYADLVPSARHGQSMPTDTHLNYSIRQPIGPVGIITPWNTPFMLATWKMAPALAAGCTVVHKPAEWSPYSAYLLAEIAHDAGLPAGVLNVVNGPGETAGQALTRHPDIRAIAFVGGTETGRAIMRQGAETIKRCHLELGGKNAAIVFDDADLDRALDAVVFMLYSLNGQRCTSSSRLLVQSSIHDAFVERVVQRVRALRMGPPLDPATEIGPLIHPQHLAKVLSYMQIAEKEGASIKVGGHRQADAGPGSFFAPTLVTQVRQSMRVAREEIFGPVLAVIPFTDEADAIAKANDSDYGLAAYIWTNDVARAHRVAQEVEVGMVWVNSENVRYLPTPFGGMKSSGIGRDGGDFSFDFYMETKNIAVSLGAGDIPKLGLIN